MHYCDQFDLSLKRQQLIFTTTNCLIKSIFVDWFAGQNEFLTEVEEIEKEELKFYISARKQDRSYYNKATLTSIRAAIIDRHLRNEPNNKPFSITSKLCLISYRFRYDYAIMISESRSPRIAVRAIRDLRESRSPRNVVSGNRGQRESLSSRIVVSANRGLRESR